MIPGNKIPCIQLLKVFGLLLFMLCLTVNGALAQDLQALLVDLNGQKLTGLQGKNKSSHRLMKVIHLDGGQKSLREVLQDIAEQAGLKLSYSEQLIPLAKKVQVQQATVTAKQALWKVLKGTSLRFGISATGQLFFFEMLQGTSTIQQETVRGTVTDASSGETLPGVNVVIKGTTTGTATDAAGRYELTVESLQDTLVFSFIGYQRQEVPIGGRTQIDVALQLQTVIGEEMVVTAFGLERGVKSLTYSTETVQTEQLTKARELNVVNSLAGQVAGISITQAGTGVGSSSRVILRGNRSITGSSQPLYVVDGVPIRGDISNISPDNIAEISVLKGPNAAALYGSSAQNGAIIISTKKGEAGEVNISLSSTFQFRQPIILTDYQNKYGQGSGGIYIPSSEYNWGPPMDGREVAHWSPDPAMAGATYSFLPQPDNVRDAFQRGYNSATNLTASVGGQTTQTLFSYTFTNAQGIVPGNELDRHNINVRVTSQLTDKLALDSKLTYIREVIDNQLSTGESFSNSIRHIYRLPRNIRTADAENFEYTTPEGANRQHFWNPGSNGGANPYWTMNRNLNENTEERVLALASLTYDFTDYLSLMARVSYDGGFSSEEEKLYNDSYVIADFGEYSVGNSNALEWNGDILLSYTQDISETWHIDVNAGGNIMQQRNASLSATTGDELTVPNFFTISNTQNVEAGQSVGSPMDVYSLYIFGQIGWRDAIYLDITGRNDWSSTLPPDNWSYFYPSVGLSAVLSDLIPSFPELFSFAKVRASWAKVGNSAPPFMTQRTASFEAGGNNGFLELSTTLPNEELRPEETISYELGLDLRFLEGRLGLDVTAYKTNTRNQLFTVDLPSPSGASEFFTNGGNVENKGIEVMLSATPVQTMNFSWDVNVNFSSNRNMVVEISDERPKLIIGDDFLRDAVIEEGKPFGQVYSRDILRDDQGRVLIASNGIPLISNGKTELVANFNPDWMGGIRSTFSYKNFSLSFLIDHRQGGSIASLTNAILYADGLTKQTLQGREGGLIFGENFFAGETAVLADANGEPTNIPNNIAIDAETFWRGVGGRNAPVGGLFVDEATNTRLREVTIGYTLPQSALAGLPISSLSISLVGRNLLFIYRASDNLDPDLMVGTSAAAEGFESFAPPNTRNFGINVDIDF